MPPVHVFQCGEDIESLRVGIYPMSSEHAGNRFMDLDHLTGVFAVTWNKRGTGTRRSRMEQFPADREMTRFRLIKIQLAAAEPNFPSMGNNFGEDKKLTMQFRSPDSRSVFIWQSFTIGDPSFSILSFCHLGMLHQ